MAGRLNVYNFLDPKLLPRVKSDFPATDNHEVSNLISEDLVSKSRGFLAYSALKPPVDVDFELLCPVKLHYITVCTTLGSQKSTGIEILVKTSQSACTTIGQAYEIEAGVTFCDGRMYSRANSPLNYDKSFRLCFFKSNVLQSCSGISFIKIRILRTQNSVPCLGNVEIWGQASRICSEVTLNSINRIMNRPSRCNAQESTLVKNDKASNISKSLAIPDDFKDALTFEIMSLPMTLPSGNTVDKSTLEKCIENEATYGRQASDPFTGLRLIDQRKPVFNFALKARIDMFLLENCNKIETFSLKRTLGRRANETKTTCDTQLTEGSCDKFYSDIDYVESSKRNKSGDDALDELIHKAMSDSNFLRFTSENNIKKPEEQSCVRCAGRNNLYVIACSHLYCRLCLIDVCKDNKCLCCSITFLKSDVKRFHI